MRGPKTDSKGILKTGAIGPVFFAASFLAGRLQVHAEYKAVAALAKGSMDYAMVVDSFVVSVIEGKLLDDILRHLGQLFGSMYASREEDSREDDRNISPSIKEELQKVPQFGILTNGLSWMQLGVIWRSHKHSANLKYGMGWQALNMLWRIFFQGSSAS